MAISTYADLKAAVADFMNRSEMTTAQQENFISLCEADIRNDVRVREMEATTSVTLTQQTLAAPTLMLEAREVHVEGRPYTYHTPELYRIKRIYSPSTYMFTSIGSNFIINASSGVASLTYYEAPAALTGTATNYILTYAPDVYLYGACAHAAQYYQDAANLERFKALYLGGVKRLNEREQNARFTGRLHVNPTLGE
jgi:hypothetical protein